MQCVVYEVKGQTEKTNRITCDERTEVAAEKQRAQDEVHCYGSVWNFQFSPPRTLHICFVFFGGELLKINAILEFGHFLPQCAEIWQEYAENWSR